MSESLGLTSHKQSCNCTGCGMLRAGVCINCAEKTAALILESPRKSRHRAVLGCLPRGDRAVLLYAARALARAASALGIGRATAAPVGQPWLWTLAYGQHEDRTPIYGYEPTREAAMAASPKAGDGSRPWQRRRRRSLPL